MYNVTHTIHFMHVNIYTHMCTTCTTYMYIHMLYMYIHTTMQVSTSVKRQLEVVFAPHLPPLEINYYISSAGVHARQPHSDCCTRTTST